MKATVHDQTVSFTLIMTTHEREEITKWHDAYSGVDGFADKEAPLPRVLIDLASQVSATRSPSTMDRGKLRCWMEEYPDAARALPVSVLSMMEQV